MTKPDIVAVLAKEGIELKKRGNYFFALCPFHKEKNPSFSVDPRRQTFHCFGCHRHGDVIAFSQTFKGLSFREALDYLGISNRQHQKRYYQAVRRRALIADFKQWCHRHHDELCSLYRTLQKAKGRAVTENDVIAIADFYHREPMWVNRIEILSGIDDRAKFELFREDPHG